MRSSHVFEVACVNGFVQVCTCQILGRHVHQITDPENHPHINQCVQYNGCLSPGRRVVMSHPLSDQNVTEYISSCLDFEFHIWKDEKNQGITRCCGYLVIIPVQPTDGSVLSMWSCLCDTRTDIMNKGSNVISGSDCPLPLFMLPLHWHIFTTQFLRRSDTFYLRV